MGKKFGISIHPVKNEHTGCVPAPVLGFNQDGTPALRRLKRSQHYESLRQNRSGSIAASAMACYFRVFCGFRGSTCPAQKTSKKSGSRNVTGGARKVAHASPTNHKHAQSTKKHTHDLLRSTATPFEDLIMLVFIRLSLWFASESAVHGFSPHPS
jgi:hypothetical protein